MDLVSWWQRLFLRYPFIWIVLASVGLTPPLWVVSRMDCFEPFQSVLPTKVKEESAFKSFDLGKKQIFFSPDFDIALEQLEWSSDPHRPDHIKEEKLLTLRMKDSKEQKKIAPSSRVFIAFDQEGLLKISSETDNFWIDVLEGYFKLGAKHLNGEMIESELIPISYQSIPPCSFHEMNEANPFKSLSDARWLGMDQIFMLMNQSEEMQRIEIGAKDKGEILNLKKNDWLVLTDNGWESSSLESANSKSPIARWVQKYSQSLEFEGWDKDGEYLRFKLDLSPSSFSKKEDLFSQLKIRSEKRISCTLDQQYLVLKPGDWVLKLDQRWKVLRKKEEKEAYFHGRLIGELLVVEKIEIKNGIKKVVGKLFNATRTQVMPIEAKPQEPQLKNKRKNVYGKQSLERRSL